MVTSIFLITFVFAGAAIAFSVYKAKKLNDLFRTAARMLDLEFTQEGKFKPVISGHIGKIGIHVFRKIYSAGKTSVDTVGYRLSFSGSMSRVLDLKAEGLFSAIEKKLGGGDIEIGSPLFDKVALVHGSNVHKVKAILHPQARRIIAEMIRKAYVRKFTISNGTMETYQIIKGDLSADSLCHELKKLVRCAELLCREGTEADLLKDNYIAESDDPVKITYLESLAAVANNLSKEDPVIKNALASRNSRIVFGAAKCIREEGYDYLRNIFPDPDPALQAGIISWISARKAEVFSGFFDRYRDSLDTEVRIKLAEFYGRIKAEDACGWLEKELVSENRNPAEYRKQLIKALGSCGNYSTIAVLNNARSSKFGRETDQAIAEIQERIGAGDSGWLSIGGTDKEEGALSVENDDD